MLEAKALTRVDLKALKENGINLHKLVLNGTNESSFDLDDDVAEKVCAHTFPDATAELDKMPYIEFFKLAMDIIGKTFGGDVEKKS